MLPTLYRATGWGKPVTTSIERPGDGEGKAGDWARACWPAGWLAGLCRIMFETFIVADHAAEATRSQSQAVKQQKQPNSEGLLPRRKQREVCWVQGPLLAQRPSQNDKGRESRLDLHRSQPFAPSTDTLLTSESPRLQSSLKVDQTEHRDLSLFWTSLASHRVSGLRLKQRCPWLEQ